MTFPQWRAQLRLHDSLTLLASGLPVIATAITDELIHHTAEAALLRDLFAGASVRS
jgi:hypothetical protein